MPLVDGVQLVVRLLVAGLVACTTLIWLADLAARKGWISPFGALARTMRKLGDPLIRPVERWLLKQGGVPSAASGWAVVLSIVVGLVAIWLAQFLAGLFYGLAGAASAGPRGLVLLAANLLFQAVSLALLVRVLGTWFGLSPYSRLGRITGALTDWILDPLRRLIPPIGGVLDLTPMLAYFLLKIAFDALVRALY